MGQMSGIMTSASVQKREDMRKLSFLQIKPNENTATLLIKRMDSGAFKVYNIIVK